MPHFSPPIQSVVAVSTESPNYPIIAFGNAHGVVRVVRWDRKLRSFTVLTKKARESSISAASAHDGKLYVAWTDGAVFSWSLKSESMWKQFAAPSDDDQSIWNGVVEGANGLVVVGGEDGVLYSLPGRAVLQPRPHDGAAIKSLVRASESRIASGGADWSIVVWSHSCTELIHRIRAHDYGVCALSPGLISGSFDQTARVWDLDTGACLATLGTGLHADSVGGVWMGTMLSGHDNDHDNQKARNSYLTVGRDGLVVLWNSEFQMENLATVQENVGALAGPAVVSMDLVFVGSTTGRLEILDLS